MWFSVLALWWTDDLSNLSLCDTYDRLKPFCGPDVDKLYYIDKTFVRSRSKLIKHDLYCQNYSLARLHTLMNLSQIQPTLSSLQGKVSSRFRSVFMAMFWAILPVSHIMKHTLDFANNLLFAFHSPFTLTTPFVVNCKTHKLSFCLCYTFI